MHERILCNVNRVKRQLTDNPSCMRYGGSEETTLHLFRDCPSSREIWRHVGGNLKADKLIFEDHWPTCFATTLWWVYALEKLCNVGQFLHIKFLDTWKVFNVETSNARINHTATREEVFIRSIAPPMDRYALNTDGVAKGSPGLVGGGGIIRDHSGRLVRGFIANFGVCSSYRDELKVVSHGLELAKELGIPKLIVQMDNSACVQALLQDEFLGGECYHILNHCREFIKHENWVVQVQHCYREGNKVADWLANKAVQQEERLITF
ncbi:hypothetical protein RDABS01_014383 [Bienertia sinuspersici]